MLHIEEESGAGEDGRHRVGMEEAAYLLVAGILEMVAGESMVFDSDLNTTGAGHLVGMDLGTEAIFSGSLEHTVGIVAGEEALVAEDVDIVGEAFGGGLRDHLVDDDVDKLVLTAAVLQRDAVGAKEGGLDGERGRLFETADDAQHFEFGLGSHAVARLDFDSASAEGSHLLEAKHGIIEELLFGSLLDTFGRVEDAATTLGNLVVGEAANLVDILDFAATSVDKMGVRVAESRKNHTSRGIDLGIEMQFGELRHRAEVRYTFIINDEISIGDGADVSHIATTNAETGLLFDLDKLFDIFEKGKHNIMINN